jgi:hypothetical protein
MLYYMLKVDGEKLTLNCALTYSTEDLPGRYIWWYSRVLIHDNPSFQLELYITASGSDIATAKKKIAIALLSYW